MIRGLLVAAIGCLVGCKHAPQSASRKYADAPTMENPLTGKVTVGIPGMTSMNEMFSLSAYDAQNICFDGNNTQGPVEAMGTRYTLAFLNTDDVDFKNAPSLRTSVVQVLNSQNELVPVTRTVQDTVRDARGNTVATVSRQVQELETHYQTQLRVCFPAPGQALTPQAHFMVMLREVQKASTWGIPGGPRSAWVWRFPAADEGPLVSAAP